MRKFFLFGDLHAGTLMRAAQSMELDFAGGSIMAGRYLNDPFFEVKNGVFRMLTDLGRERLAIRLQGLGENLFDLDMPFLCTLGFNTHHFAVAFRAEHFAIRGSKGKWFVSAACFDAGVTGARQGTFAFYAALCERGKDVYAVRSPQRFNQDQASVWKAYEDVVVKRLTAMGVHIVDIRAETTDSRGALRPEFASVEPNDQIHANDNYARIVLDRFAEMLEPATQKYVPALERDPC